MIYSKEAIPIVPLEVGVSTSMDERRGTAAPRLLRLAAAAAGALALGGCVMPASESEVEAARQFDEYPLYWVGEEFEGLPLVHVDTRPESAFATFIYGDCEPRGWDGGCPPPLQLQISPLCSHLEVVRLAPPARRRMIRGAPAGVGDHAPVLLTEAVQVKAYAGAGVDAGIAERALAALRSVNTVAPVVAEGDPISPAPAAILEGERPCEP